MSEGRVIVPESGPPKDSIPGTVCPLRSSATVAMSSTGIGKVSVDVECRRNCMLYAEVDGKHRCAIAILAFAVAERS